MVQLMSLSFPFPLLSCPFLFLSVGGHRYERSKKLLVTRTLLGAPLSTLSPITALPGPSTGGEEGAEATWVAEAIIECGPRPSKRYQILMTLDS